MCRAGCCRRWFFATIPPPNKLFGGGRAFHLIFCQEGFGVAATRGASCFSSRCRHGTRQSPFSIVAARRNPPTSINSKAKSRKTFFRGFFFFFFFPPPN